MVDFVAPVQFDNRPYGILSGLMIAVIFFIRCSPFVANDFCRSEVRYTFGHFVTSASFLVAPTRRILSEIRYTK